MIKRTQQKYKVKLLIIGLFLISQAFVSSACSPPLRRRCKHTFQMHAGSRAASPEATTGRLVDLMCFCPRGQDWMKPECLHFKADDSGDLFKANRASFDGFYVFFLSERVQNEMQGLRLWLNKLNSHIFLVSEETFSSSASVFDPGWLPVSVLTQQHLNMRNCWWDSRFDVICFVSQPGLCCCVSFCPVICSFYSCDGKTINSPRAYGCWKWLL